MAPEQPTSPPARRRTGANRENQYLFNLGVKGRKTGVELPDTGIRDANGLEPMDDLFSPDKPESAKTSRSANGPRRHALEDVTISSEEDMDMVGENTATEPNEVLNQRRQDARMAMPIPRSRSPLKTHLQSPARRHPKFGISSPTKGASSETDDTGPGRGKPGRPALGSLTNGTRLSPGRRPPPSVDQNSDAAQNQDESALEFEEDSNHYDAPDDDEEDALVDVLEGNSEIAEEEEEESELEPEPSPPRKAAGKSKGKSKAIEEPEQEKPAPKRRGRKPKNSAQVEAVEEEQEPEVEERHTKKVRRSTEFVDAVEATKPIKRKQGRSSNAAKSTTAAKPKATAKPKFQIRPKMAPIFEVDSPQVHRAGMQRTRSGRNSIKPLAFWKNERVEYDDEETVPDGTHGAKILLPSIKEVIRADEIEQQKHSRSRSSKPTKSKSKKRAREEVDDDSETEEWESQPGRIEGSVRIWDPEDQVGENAEETVEDLAFSSAAIKTRDIPNASFKFAKTLTLPFFGSDANGVFSSSMAESKFQSMGLPLELVRVGCGKSLEETSTASPTITIKPARIFFAQGCEVGGLPSDSEGGGAAQPANQ
ncbi:hypothetical protein DID88_002809 [Monilinia fructigena]|uniref:Mif2 N-terminal domain-containing protein n=1 Tax=Monilinia fructigena TaxID=38457 RepID=A0A395IQQ2_9HELO|nr:hypothetical protein DID88_002809 [Monilinia fructigena]